MCIVKISPHPKGDQSKGGGVVCNCSHLSLVAFNSSAQCTSSKLSISNNLQEVFCSSCDTLLERDVAWMVYYFRKDVKYSNEYYIYTAAMMMPRHVMKTPAGMISKGRGRARQGQGTKIPSLPTPPRSPSRMVVGLNK